VLRSFGLRRAVGRHARPQKAGAVLRELGYRHVAALPSYEDWLAARAPVEHVAPRRTQRASASAAA
jgi:hypothetical protein